MFQKARFGSGELPAAVLQGLQGGMELPKNEPLTVVMCCKATTGAVLQRLNLLVAPPSHFPNKGYTLWKTNIALENHNFLWVNPVNPL